MSKKEGEAYAEMYGFNYVEIEDFNKEGIKKMADSINGYLLEVVTMCGVGGQHTIEKLEKIMKKR